MRGRALPVRIATGCPRGPGAPSGSEGHLWRLASSYRRVSLYSSLPFGKAGASSIKPWLAATSSLAVYSSPHFSSTDTLVEERTSKSLDPYRTPQRDPLRVRVHGL